MNFKIREIRKGFYHDRNSTPYSRYDYLVSIELPDMDGPLQVCCTHYQLLHFEKLQFKVMVE